MNVHVVAERLHADRILPRLAKYLAVGNNWTLAEEPDQNADANYFCNYLTWRQRFNGWNQTWTSAFFTHRDDTVALKARIWDEAARGIDQCVICASKFEAVLPAGKVAYARAPVEVDRFTLKEAPEGERPVIGFCGFVYKDGRKGEDIAGRLVKRLGSSRYRWVASGRGWPVPTTSRPWGEMPAFFQSLNVLVLTSRNEGIPMPPLEALACGVSIVVPHGCGMLDDLPSIPGIFRYQAGDEDELRRTVEKAAYSRGIDRAALRQVIVNDYTVAAWCEDHKRVIAEGCPAGAPTLFSPERLAELEETDERPPWQEASGVYIVGFGKPSRKCAKELIASVRHRMPGLPVCFVGANALGVEDVFVKQPDRDIGGRIAKIRAYNLAPQDWKYILYLDADTEAVEDIGFLFQLLEDGWEMSICRDMQRYHTADKMLRPDNRSEASFTWDMVISAKGTMQFNGGMMSFRRCFAVKRFFDLWEKEWQRFGGRDQGALLRALYQQPVKLYTLTNHWNASDRYPNVPGPGSVAIWHHSMKARRWSGLIHDRIDSPAAWSRVREWQRVNG